MSESSQDRMHGALASIDACISEVDYRVEQMIRDSSTPVAAVVEAFRDALATVQGIAIRELYRKRTAEFD